LEYSGEKARERERERVGEMMFLLSLEKMKANLSVLIYESEKTIEEWER
jgi:hypothetical protein